MTGALNRPALVPVSFLVHPHSPDSSWSKLGAKQEHSRQFWTLKSGPDGEPIRSVQRAAESKGRLLAPLGVPAEKARSSPSREPDFHYSRLDPGQPPWQYCAKPRALCQGAHYGAIAARQRAMFPRVACGTRQGTAFAFHPRVAIGNSCFHPAGSGMSKSQAIELLVVDDDAEFRETLVRRMDRGGFAVSSAAGGDEALDLAQRRRFDVAVFDMMMPGMSGLALLQKFR